MHVIERTDASPFGKISLPSFHEFNERHYQAFWDSWERHVTSRGNETLSVWEQNKIFATIAIECIEAWRGDWDFNDITLSDFKSNRPVLLTHWLADEFMEYIRVFTDPNGRGRTSEPPTSNEDKESPAT